MYIRGTQQWFSSHNIHWKHFLGYPEYFLMGAMKFVLFGHPSPGNLSLFKIIFY